MVFVLFSREFYAKGWPEPFIYGIFSRDFVRYNHIRRIYRVLANPTYTHMVLYASVRYTCKWFWPTLHTHICRVGQNHIYTVYIRYFWQGNHQIYGHMSYTVCIYGSGQPYTYAHTRPDRSCTCAKTTSPTLPTSNTWRA